MKLIIILVMSLLLFGCGSTVDNRQNKEIIQEDSVSILYRFEDNKYEVVCWWKAIPNKGGLSCLPKDQLKEK